jgi:hypothetical protein
MLNVKNKETEKTSLYFDVNHHDSLLSYSRQHRTTRSRRIRAKSSTAERSSTNSNCARVIWKKLSWMPWSPRWSKDVAGGFLDRYNLELAHQHLVFESTGENIGYAPRAIVARGEKRFSDYLYGTLYSYPNNSYRNPRSFEVRASSGCYDEKIMKKAVKKTAAPRYYFLVGSNCQKYIDAVLKNYKKIADTLVRVQK